MNKPTDPIVEILGDWRDNIAWDLQAGRSHKVGRAKPPEQIAKEIRKAIKEENKDKVCVSKATIDKVLNALNNNWFYCNGEDEWNNDDIIEAEEILRAELE